MFMKMGENWPNKYDLKSLRIIGSVGEPLNPEAFEWYYHVIGKDRCPDPRYLVADGDRDADDHYDDWRADAPGICRKTDSWCYGGCC